MEQGQSPPYTLANPRLVPLQVSPTAGTAGCSTHPTAQEGKIPLWDDVRGLQQISRPCQPTHSSQPFPTAGLCLLSPWGCRTRAQPYIPGSFPVQCIPKHPCARSSALVSWHPCRELCPPLLAHQIPGVLLPLVLCQPWGFLPQHQEFWGGQAAPSSLVRALGHSTAPLGPGCY